MKNQLKYYSVRAHSGRYNGEALILTTSKKQAKRIAQEQWLEFGVVDSVQTVEEVVNEEDSIYSIEEDYQMYMNELIEDGDMVEIEWST